MGRIPRIYIENACYHIMARGNNKQSVFKDDDDFNVFLNIVKKAKRKYEFLLHSYCMMPNHIHLLIAPKSSRDISLLMHWINRGYADYYNRKYKAVGHLWQGRFRSKPIIRDEYLESCACYIESNPVRAGITDNITAYKWSSYGERCMKCEKAVVDEISIDDFGGVGGQVASGACTRYKGYYCERLNQYSRSLRPETFGSNTFLFSPKM